VTIELSGTAAITLAAGSSRRMGGGINKLLAEVDGEPMIRRVVRTVLAARVSRVVVVLGHEADRVRAVLADLDVTTVENPDHAAGMASSLRVGLDVVSAHVSVLVALGDMPWVRVETLNRLIAEAGPGRIVVPVHDGRRGNPVLWDRCFFPQLLTLVGDAGGRAIIAARPDAVRAVFVDDPGALRDADTPDAFPHPL